MTGGGRPGGACGGVGVGLGRLAGDCRFSLPLAPPCPLSLSLYSFLPFFVASRCLCPSRLSPRMGSFPSLFSAVGPPDTLLFPRLQQPSRAWQVGANSCDKAPQQSFCVPVSAVPPPRVRPGGRAAPDVRGPLPPPLLCRPLHPRLTSAGPPHPRALCRRNPSRPRVAVTLGPPRPGQTEGRVRPGPAPPAQRRRWWRKRCPLPAPGPLPPAAPSQGQRRLAPLWRWQTR